MKNFLIEHHFAIILGLSSVFLGVHLVIGLVDSLRQILGHDESEAIVACPDREELLQQRVLTVLPPIRRVFLVTGFYGSGGLIAQSMQLSDRNSELVGALGALALMVGLYVMMNVFGWIDTAKEEDFTSHLNEVE